ncbi:MAG: ABC transporter substrate-binding protein [Bryobacteraceae bacterium]
MHRRQMLALCGAAALGCRTHMGGSLRRLKVSSHMTLSASSLHLADELGYFHEMGLEIEHVHRDSTSEVMVAAAGGELDVQFTVMNTAFLNAVLRGARVRIVAGREIARPGCGDTGVICALRRRFPDGLADLRVLKGKRVASGPSVGFLYFVLDEHLSQAGLSTKDVTTVPLGWPENYTALLSGSIDAMVLSDSMPGHRDSGLLVFSRGLGELRPNFQYSYIFFGRTMLEEPPDLGRRFLRAYFQGAREFVRGRSPSYMKKFAEYRKIDVADLKDVCRESFSLDGTVDRESLEAFSSWAHQRGLAPRLAEFHELTDLRFLEKL